jgi:hypothetical protein
VADIALFTTTIYNPVVLRQYRASDPDVLFIIVGDKKTPHDDVRALCREVGNAIYYDPRQQEALGYACSDTLGWNNIQRRNIALLEAIKSGAQIVLSVDDDNAPRSEKYFEDLRRSLEGAAGYLANVGNGSEWFNLGAFADRFYYYRGFPFSLRGKRLRFGSLQSVTPGTERVGIVNGLIYGDPDINAIDRAPGRPVARADHYVDSNTYVNPRTTWTPINSQNTAYVRELAPLAFVLPGIGRYDDIWASYIAQRVMEATDYRVYFGEPSVVQERNPHNWLKDLENEIYGMQHTEAFCEDLKAVAVDDGASVLLNLEAIRLGASRLLPRQTRDFMNAWMDDVARVL